MKRVILNRKNSLFVGNQRGGRTAAIVASLTSTCRRHDIDPQLYLTQLLVNMPTTPIAELPPGSPTNGNSLNQLRHGTDSRDPNLCFTLRSPLFADFRPSVEVDCDSGYSALTQRVTRRRRSTVVSADTFPISWHPDEPLWVQDGYTEDLPWDIAVYNPRFPGLHSSHPVLSSTVPMP